MYSDTTMGPIARHVAHLASRAATRAVAHARAAEASSRAYRPAALDAAVQADDAAVRALHAARHHRYAELFGHLATAVDAERRARTLEQQAVDQARDQPAASRPATA